MANQNPEQSVEQWQALAEERVRRLARGFLFLEQRSEEMEDRFNPMLVLRAAHEYTGTVEVTSHDSLEFVTEAIKAGFIDETKYEDQLHQPRGIALSLLELSHEKKIGSSDYGRSFIHPDFISDEPEIPYIAPGKPRF